ncbi:hypothetical protein AB9L11_11895 [Desulfovibrio piger]
MARNAPRIFDDSRGKFAHSQSRQSAACRILPGRNTDEAVIPGAFPVDVVFFGTLNGCPCQVYMVPHHPVCWIFSGSGSHCGRHGLYAVLIHGRYHIAQRVIEWGVIVGIVSHKACLKRCWCRDALIERDLFQCPRIVRRRAGTGQLAQGVIFVRQIDDIPGLSRGERVHVVEGIRVFDGHARKQPVRVGDRDAAFPEDQHIVVLRLRVELEGDQDGLAAKIGNETHPRPALDIAMQVGDEVLAALQKAAEFLQVVTGGEGRGHFAAREIAERYAGHGLHHPGRVDGRS